MFFSYKFWVVSGFLDARGMSNMLTSDWTEKNLQAKMESNYFVENFCGENTFLTY